MIFVWRPPVLGATSASAQDAKAGEKKAPCASAATASQGYQASFPEIHKVPMIRGRTPSTSSAGRPTRRASASTRHESHRRLAERSGHGRPGAFYEASGGLAANGDAPARTAPARWPSWFTKGNCASCHGENLNSKPIDLSYPKLAGQHGDYLYVALKAYQTDGNAQVGRGNAIMAGMAQALQPRRAEAAGRLPRHAAGRPEDRAGVALPLTRAALPKKSRCSSGFSLLRAAAQSSPRADTAEAAVTADGGCTC